MQIKKLVFAAVALSVAAAMFWPPKLVAAGDADHD